MHLNELQPPKGATREQSYIAVSAISFKGSPTIQKVNGCHMQLPSHSGQPSFLYE